MELAGWILKGAGIGLALVLCAVSLKYAWGIPLDMEAVFKFLFGLLPIGVAMMAVGAIGLFFFGKKD